MSSDAVRALVSEYAFRILLHFRHTAPNTQLSERPLEHLHQERICGCQTSKGEPMLYCTALHVSSSHIVCTQHRSHPQSGLCVLVYTFVDRVRNLEEEFYCHATATDLQREMGLTPKLSTLLYNYWKLKRIVRPIAHLQYFHSLPYCDASCLFLFHSQTRTDHLLRQCL